MDVSDKNKTKQQKKTENDCNKTMFFYPVATNTEKNKRTNDSYNELLKKFLKYIHACVCMYIYKIIIHSTHTYIM